MGWAPPAQSWGKASPAKGWGKDSWGQDKGKGWGKGKGKGKKSGGIFKTDPLKKIWIGGFPAQEQVDKDLNTKLQEFCKQAGDCTNVMIGKNGKGSAAFATEEEAQAAIVILNGTWFE